MFSIISKLKINKKKHVKELDNKIINYIDSIEKKIKKRSITFLHSGHLGDLINSLPVVKEYQKELNVVF